MGRWFTSAQTDTWYWCREKNDVNRRWTSEDEGISVSRIERGGACAEKRVLCRNLPRS